MARGAGFQVHPFHTQHFQPGKGEFPSAAPQQERRAEYLLLLAECHHSTPVRKHTSKFDSDDLGTWHGP